MNNIPKWREREIAAEAVNQSPGTDGIWKCERCGAEWIDALCEADYDRTTDSSNWPVLCNECLFKMLPTTAGVRRVPWSELK